MNSTANTQPLKWALQCKLQDGTVEGVLGASDACLLALRVSAMGAGTVRTHDPLRGIVYVLSVNGFRFMFEDGVRPKTVFVRCEHVPEQKAAKQCG